MRVLLGTLDIHEVIPDLAAGLREIGHDVTTVVLKRDRFNPHTKYDLDIDLYSPHYLRWPAWLLETQIPIIRFPRGMIKRLVLVQRLWHLIRSHDVFIYTRAGLGLTQGARELPLLQRLGKRVVVMCVGSDARHEATFMRQYCDQAYGPDMTAAALADDVSRPLSNLRHVELYSNVILSRPDVMNLALRPYMHHFKPIVLDKYRFQLPARERPVIIHAPSRRGIKGTRYIVEALRRLRDEGIKFDFHLLENVPNELVRMKLTDADVVVDQLYLLTNGKLGLEAMASGCAYATCNRTDHDPIPPERPFHHVELMGLTSRLRQLLTDRSLRVHLALEGRRYVAQYHDNRAVARRIVSLVNSRCISRFDHYPEYFARFFTLPPGTELPTRVQNQTLRVARKHGLPNGITIHDLVARGLATADGANAEKRKIR